LWLINVTSAVFASLSGVPLSRRMMNRLALMLVCVWAMPALSVSRFVPGRRYAQQTKIKGAE